MIYIDDITPEMVEEYKIKEALIAKEIEDQIQEEITPVEITEENLHSARFANDERDVIEVLIGDNDEYEAIAVIVDPEEELFQQLMKITNLDDIELETLETIQREAEAIQNLHVELIENNIATPPADVDVSENILKGFLNELIGDEESSDDDLFKVKLLAFEMQKIIDAPVEIKESIRAASTQFEVFTIIKNYGDSL